MAAASLDYPFGTDNLQALYLLLYYAGRYSLTYAGILLAIMLAISIPLGLLCGYIGGKFDLIVAVQMQLWLFPTQLWLWQSQVY